MKKSSIVIVQRDPHLRRILEKMLEELDYHYYSADSLQQGYQMINDRLGQVVLLEDEMEEEKSRKLLRYIYETFDEMETILIANTPSIPDAVAAVKDGAVDYITADQLAARLPAGLRTVEERIDRHAAQSSEELAEIDNPAGIIGRSEALRVALQKAQKAAESRETVMIIGESGTGKELIARAIHYHNAQSGVPFIPVNCGGIPTNLLESELFGHVKGAYTGADESTNGYFQAADTGTIFLDEISNTSLSMQAKLLRVLESDQIWKVGSRKPEIIDVRVISASNKNLRTLVKDKKFREDLYYRLNVINIRIPPLRERQSDIELLCTHFARKYAEEMDKEPLEFSDEVLDIFHAYDWPGNIRELKNLIKREVLLSEHPTVNVCDLPKYMHRTVSDFYPEPKTLAKVERAHIEMVMNQVDWNISRAAKILGISRQTLYNKLEQFSLRRVSSSPAGNGI